MKTLEQPIESNNTRLFHKKISSEKTPLKMPAFCTNQLHQIVADKCLHGKRLATKLLK